MKVFLIFISVFLCVFVGSLQGSYAQELNVSTVDYELVGEPGTIFNKGYGQCVDFVKWSRDDLKEDIGIVGIAANMPTKAKAKRYEVNNIPREGAVIVMPNTRVGGVKTGHVAIVTKVELMEDGLYNLTFRDANARNDIRYVLLQTLSRKKLKLFV